MTASFVAILKNISILMDDVPAISKVALHDTVGILGDDLAVNAKKASGFSATRELPVLFAITIGSLINKIYLVPLIFIIYLVVPWILAPVLVFGGLFLAWEGYHSILQLYGHHSVDEHEVEDLTNSEKDILALEKKKIDSAISTDRILSIEIIIIALNSVGNYSPVMQFIAVSIVALLATVGVYGIVGFIVRLDDMGRWVIRKSIKTVPVVESPYKLEPGNTLHSFKTEVIVNIYGLFFGNAMVYMMHSIIKYLGWIGTFAMFAVSGEIFIHNIPFLHHVFEGFHWLITLTSAVVLSITVGAFVYFGEVAIRKLNTK